MEEGGVGGIPVTLSQSGNTRHQADLGQVLQSKEGARGGDGGAPQSANHFSSNIWSAISEAGSGGGW